MARDRIVLVTCVIDQDDILEEFIRWHLDLGVDLIIVQDVGSKDATGALLDRCARDGRVIWFAAPGRDMTKYKLDDALANLARDTYQADWIILCDADEFLCCVGEDLRATLRDATAGNVSTLNIQCFNMTGPSLRPGERAVEKLTLRIDKPVTVTAEESSSGELRVPYIFIRHPPHTIVRGSSFKTYEAGAHAAQVYSGETESTDRLRFLHYCIRGFHKFDIKIRNTADWLRDNPHLPPWWGWHWRRWIRLQEAGRLRDDYEAQFPSTARAQELIRDGTCALDETVANWARRRGLKPTWRQKALARLIG